jgi:hypothetical protein
MTAQVTNIGWYEWCDTWRKEGQRPGQDGGQIGWNPTAARENIDEQSVLEGPDGNQRHPIRHQEYADGNDQDAAYNLECPPETSVRIAPRVAPMQGVQPAAKNSPIKAELA